MKMVCFSMVYYSKCRWHCAVHFQSSSPIEGRELFVGLPTNSDWHTVEEHKGKITGGEIFLKFILFNNSILVKINNTYQKKYNFFQLEN